MAKSIGTVALYALTGPLTDDQRRDRPEFRGLGVRSSTARTYWLLSLQTSLSALRAQATICDIPGVPLIPLPSKLINC